MTIWATFQSLNVKTLYDYGDLENTGQDQTHDQNVHKSAAI